MLVFKKSILKKIDEKKIKEEINYTIDYPNFETFYKKYQEKKKADEMIKIKNKT